jgi:hypothetical protein
MDDPAGEGPNGSGMPSGCQIASKCELFSRSTMTPLTEPRPASRSPPRSGAEPVVAGREWRAGGYARFLKRPLSLPVSMMSQWCVSRSSMAVVILGVAEHLRPVGEGQIGSDQQRRILMELADQVEQQLAAGLAERQVAEFVRHTHPAKPGRLRSFDYR